MGNEKISEIKQKLNMLQEKRKYRKIYIKNRWKYSVFGKNKKK